MNQNDNLHKLNLVDGLPAKVGDREIRYRVVHLRETTVADERIAQRQAERVVTVAGRPTLMASDADFRFALTVRHIEAFECDGQRIPQAMIDLDLAGKLSAHDLGLIEQRVFLINLAAEVRYGTLSLEDFELIASGQRRSGDESPQLSGQTEGVGQRPVSPQSGPALLADFTGGHSDSEIAGDGI